MNEEKFKIVNILIMEKTPVQKRFEYLNFDTMRNAGFNLLAFSVMLCEDTFYFSTTEEAEEAYRFFEFGENATGEYVGFWYSIEDIEKNKEDYKEDFYSELEIIYIND
jgi:hypothetical protein